MALSRKQQVWIENYLITWNATEAARRAGYAFPNVEGPKNLVNPSIKALVKARIDELVMSADEALIRLSEQARGSLADFADIKLLENLKNHPKAHLVKVLITDVVYNEITRETRYKTRTELHDQQRALEDILKIHGKFKDTVTNLNYDLSKATDEQLQRIAAGDDPATVLQQNPTTGGG